VIFNRLWLLVLLVAVELGVWRHLPLLIVGGLLGLAIGGAQLLWGRFCLSGVEYERRLGASHALWGEEVQFSVRIANRKVLPLTWLLAEDRMPGRLPIDRAPLVRDRFSPLVHLKSLLPLLPYEQVTRRYTVHCHQRGLFEFGPGRLESGDLLGYLRRVARYDKVDRLLIYPKVLDLDVPAAASMRLIGPRVVDRVILTDPSRTVGVRPYQPGDPLHHVEWRATARTQNVLVRVFEPTTDPAVAIFLNSDVPRTEYDYYDPPELEFCISLAASLAKWLLDKRHPIGLFGNGEPTGPGAVRLPVSGGPEQFQRVLETLALASPFGPVRTLRVEWWQGTDLPAYKAVTMRPPMSQLLLKESARLPFEISILLITADWDADLLAAVREVRRRRPVTVLFVQTAHSAAEAEGADAIHVPYAEGWQALERLQLAA